MMTIALSLVTLTLYVPWWLYRQTRVINAHAQQSRIPDWMVHAGMISGMVIVGLNLFVLTTASPESAQSVPMQPDPTLQGISLIANIILLAWAFVVRNGINELARASRGDAAWIGIVLTILFSVFYLQYKINRILDTRRPGAP